MNPSTNAFRRVVTVGCALGLLTLSFGSRGARAAAGESTATAATGMAAAPHARPVDLHLDDGAAARLAMAESGAAQETDTEKPRPMGEEPTVTVTKRNPGDKEPADKTPARVPEKNRYGFLKSWPFWVIVGGGIVATVALVVLLRNSSEKTPCGMQFDSGCFPD